MEDAMAFLEQRGNGFRVIFRYAGRRYTHNLKTDQENVAQGLMGGIEKTLMLLEQKLLRVPEATDALTFIVSNGYVEKTTAHPNLLGVGGIGRRIIYYFTDWIRSTVPIRINPT
jgi:hypothetical protein